ncbi:hypothetical protein [Spirosoma utsteinense]|uniref:Uncharacterized protein n=1 Tax=Spirosoma utsteinense TaxID=2585773 RepID=A0ABR6W7D9_9BACT|nr:hypothetical protein [Spirosoma utsteinense]MBC3792139.1 hypothetical protein [Spirosoma utsteinense]
MGDVRSRSSSRFKCPLTVLSLMLGLTFGLQMTTPFVPDAR